MGKQTKVLHGSCSEVFINGQRETLATKIEVKITGDFEDATFCGDYGTFPLYNGYAVEGTLTGKKADSSLEVAIAEGYRTGIMPDIVLMTSLTNPVTRQAERWSPAWYSLRSRWPTLRPRRLWNGSCPLRRKNIRIWRPSNEQTNHI